MLYSGRDIDSVTNGTLEIMKYLVENEADVNGKSTDERTALHSAVTGGALKMVKYLVENGADVNGRDIDV